MVLSLVNVTERKRAEQAAKAEQAFRRSIEDSIIAGVVAADTEGRLTYVNRAFCRMVGWTEEELLGSKPPYVYWPQEERNNIYQSLSEILRGKHLPCSYERLFCRKNGERFHTLVSISPLKDAGGKLTGITGAFMDITERKKMEEALKQSESQLKHLPSELLHIQESERKRIAIELHDTIGQSLSAIKFKIEHALILKSEEVDEACNSLVKVVTMVQHAIEEVRKICMDLRPSVLDDLGITIDQLIKIQEHEIPLSLKIIIFRIIQESLNNIAKHSDVTTVRLSLQKVENCIELLVSGNGSGFEPDAIQARSSLGRGFGLASMKERAQVSGGTFELNSKPGHSTTIKAVRDKITLILE